MLNNTPKRDRTNNQTNPVAVSVNLSPREVELLVYAIDRVGWPGDAATRTQAASLLVRFQSIQTKMKGGKKT